MTKFTFAGERVAVISVDAGSYRQFRVLRFSGELDLDSLQTLRRALATTVMPDARIIINLFGVPFLDSASIGQFVQLQRKLTDRGGAMVMVWCQPNVLRLLQRTRLTSVFGVFEWADQAADHLAALP